MAHKAAQLIGGGHACSQRLAAHSGIKLRIGGLHVRLQKEAADAEGERAEQQPAKEGQLQDEVIPLFAVHHLVAQLHGAGSGHVGVFGQQIGYERVAVVPINSRHNKQKETQKNL